MATPLHCICSMGDDGGMRHGELCLSWLVDVVCCMGLSCALKL